MVPKMGRMKSGEFELLCFARDLANPKFAIFLRAEIKTAISRPNLNRLA